MFKFIKELRVSSIGKMFKFIMPFTVEEKVLSISFVAAKGLIQIFLNGLKLKFIIIRCGEKRV